MVDVMPKKCILDVMDKIYMYDDDYNCFEFTEDEFIPVTLDEAVDHIVDANKNKQSTCILHK